MRTFGGLLLVSAVAMVHACVDYDDETTQIATDAGGASTDATSELPDVSTGLDAGVADASDAGRASRCSEREPPSKICIDFEDGKLGLPDTIQGEAGTLTVDTTEPAGRWLKATTRSSAAAERAYLQATVPPTAVRLRWSVDVRIRSIVPGGELLRFLVPETSSCSLLVDGATTDALRLLEYCPGTATTTERGRIAMPSLDVWVTFTVNVDLVTNLVTLAVGASPPLVSPFQPQTKDKPMRVDFGVVFAPAGPGVDVDMDNFALDWS